MRRPSGHTFLEVLIALAITGLLGTALAAVFQTLTSSASLSAWERAQRDHLRTTVLRLETVLRQGRPPLRVDPGGAEFTGPAGARQRIRLTPDGELVLEEETGGGPFRRRRALGRDIEGLETEALELDPGGSGWRTLAAASGTLPLASRAMLRFQLTGRALEGRPRCVLRGAAVWAPRD